MKEGRPEVTLDAERSTGAGKCKLKDVVEQGRGF